jgi:hypothetical protein
MKQRDHPVAGATNRQKAKGPGHAGTRKASKTGANKQYQPTGYA